MDKFTKHKLDELLDDLTGLVVAKKFNDEEQKVVLETIDSLHALVEEQSF